MKLLINILLSFDLGFDAEKVFRWNFPKKKLSKLRTESIPEKGAQHFFVQWYPRHTCAKYGIIICGGVDFYRGELMQGVKRIFMTLFLAVLSF
ncbi:hypothetical protein, partial [Escherichia coli]|uniref:hypothetical protein n=1 Tax=Escherichia coli TaxID=562 RepID=UPI003D036A67